jgi:hypothetical protein
LGPLAAQPVRKIIDNKKKNLFIKYSSKNDTTEN